MDVFGLWFTWEICHILRFMEGHSKKADFLNSFTVLKKCYVVIILSRSDGLYQHF